MMDFGNALWQPEWDERPQHFIAFAGGIGMSPIVSCMNRALKSDVGHTIHPVRIVSFRAAPVVLA